MIPISGLNELSQVIMYERMMEARERRLVSEARERRADGRTCAAGWPASS